MLLCHVGSIKITALPEKAAGYLMLDNLYVVENQVIYREDFDSLRLVSKSETVNGSFKFKPNAQEYEIECALLSLDEKKRVIFVRRYFYSEPIEKIAWALGMKSGSVKSILSRTRQSLREILEEEELL